MREFRKILIVLSLLMILVLVPNQIAFSTKASANSDSIPPIAPKGLTVTYKTCTSISLSWTSSTDNIKVKGYQVYRDGRKIITTTKLTYTNSNLVPGKKYNYTVRAYDAAGNVSVDSTAVEAASVPDNQAPSLPGNPAISSTGYTSVVLSWSPSADNISIKGYTIYRNGSKAGTTTSTSYTAKGLLPGTAYNFSVKACDKAGNESVQSSMIAGITLPDRKAPDKPTGLKVSTVSETEATLMWTPSSDNVKVKGYEIFCNGVKAGTSSKTIFNARKLIPGQSYKYSVLAVDTVSNKSLVSEQLTVTALKDVKKPTAPSELKADKVKGTSASLQWNTSTDNTKVTGYIIYCNGLELAKSTRTSKTVKSPLGLGIDIYWVKAVDLSGNLSNASNKITVISR